MRLTKQRIARLRSSSPKVNEAAVVEDDMVRMVVAQESMDKMDDVDIYDLFDDEEDMEDVPAMSDKQEALIAPFETTRREEGTSQFMSPSTRPFRLFSSCGWMSLGARPRRRRVRHRERSRMRCR
jgi:hypothetical protein